MTFAIAIVCIAITIVLVQFILLIRYRFIVKKISAELTAVNSQEKNNLKNAEHLQSQLSEAREDPITHLMGMSLFEERVNLIIRESIRYNLTFGILFVDIDDFKIINDGLGREAGDLMLNDVAQRLKLTIRKVDSVARYSKDTFVILLSKLAKPSTAAIVAQRILVACNVPFIFKNQEYSFTSSIGVAVYPGDGQDIATLFRNAEQALMLAKEKGKHVYQFYQQQLHDQSLRELSLITGLKRDAFLSELQIFYQPIVNVNTANILCMDTTTHWMHSELGRVEESELIAYAKRQMKLNLITEWLLENAGLQFVKWQAENQAPKFLGITIYAEQLENSNFIYRLSNILQTIKLDPQYLLLEIKEDEKEISHEAFEKAINMLTYLGVKLAINGFCSGNYSLSQLRFFPIHCIKLNAQLIQDVDSNPKTAAIIRAMQFLAVELNTILIVQGIDTTKQAAVIRGLNCVYVQGEVFGPPVNLPTIKTTVS